MVLQPVLLSVGLKLWKDITLEMNHDNDSRLILQLPPLTQSQYHYGSHELRQEASKQPSKEASKQKPPNVSQCCDSVKKQYSISSSNN